MYIWEGKVLCEYKQYIKHHIVNKMNYTDSLRIVTVSGLVLSGLIDLNYYIQACGNRQKEEWNHSYYILIHLADIWL